MRQAPISMAKELASVARARALANARPSTQPRRLAHSTAVTINASCGGPDRWNCLTHRAQTGESSTRGEQRGPLAGWPISIKDNFCTADMPTTCASKMLSDYTPSFDATVVSLLRRSGATLIGKTNLDEFAMGSANVHSHFGPVINPAAMDKSKDEEPRAAGGSSGGAAASVRAGLCRV